MVLLNDDFSSIVAGISEGRLVFENLVRGGFRARSAGGSWQKDLRATLHAPGAGRKSRLPTS